MVHGAQCARRYCRYNTTDTNTTSAAAVSEQQVDTDPVHVMSCLSNSNIKAVLESRLVLVNTTQSKAIDSHDDAVFFRPSTLSLSLVLYRTHTHAYT